MDTRQFALLLMLAFGSAATFMFWAKWLGKLVGIAGSPDNIEHTVHRSEWFATGLMAVMAVLACVLIPVISNYMVEPYVGSVLGISIQPILDDDLFLSAIMVVCLVVLFLGALRKKSPNMRRVEPYMAGVTFRDDKDRTFINSLSQPQEATSRNWYLDGYFGRETSRSCWYVSLLDFDCRWILVGYFGCNRRHYDVLVERRRQ